MQEQPKIAVLAESGYRSVMGLKSVLEHAGIEARVMQPPNAGKGWGTKFWLAVASEDAEKALEALRAEWFANATPEERAAAAHVVDHAASEVTCPACGAVAPGGTAECPDCGLALM